MTKLSDSQRFVLLAIYDAGGSMPWDTVMDLRQGRRINASTFWNLLDRKLIERWTCPTCRGTRAGYKITPAGVEAVHE